MVRHCRARSENGARPGARPRLEAFRPGPRRFQERATLLQARRRPSGVAAAGDRWVGGEGVGDPWVRPRSDIWRAGLSSPNLSGAGVCGWSRGGRQPPGSAGPDKNMMATGSVPHPPKVIESLPVAAYAQRRELVLDGVRGIAIFLVLFHHFVIYSGLPMDVSRSDGLDWYLALFGRATGLGVDVFFVLSGVLNAGIDYDTKSAPGFFRTLHGRRTVLAVVFFAAPALSRARAPDRPVPRRIPCLRVSRFQRGRHDREIIARRPRGAASFRRVACASGPARPVTEGRDRD
jgi:hypothetical protein